MTEGRSHEKLRRKIEALLADIQTIKEAETYVEISCISDWDAYFQLMKEKLQQELKHLKQTVSKAESPSV